MIYARCGIVIRVYDKNNYDLLFDKVELNDRYRLSFVLN
jgi:hypothetical protein